MKPFLLFSSLSSKEKVLLGLWSLFSLCLFFYSFTQIDLGLVVSRYPFFYSIEQAFQYIGYFRRDISVQLYAGILLFGFSLFAYTLKATIKQQLSEKGVGIIVVIASCVLAFSYNAFSYDFFNYIFDAKILTHYHLNPYEYKALDFPADPMLGFMHWTHRTYPYGPVWLMLTVPLSFIANNIFIITFFLLKLLTLSIYLLFGWYFYQTAKIIQEKHALFSTVFLLLNPLFLVEFLVSGHNDSSMLAFGFMGIYYLLKKRQILGYLWLFISIGVKFATVFLLPAFIFASIILVLKNRFPMNRFLYFATAGMVVAFIAVCYRTVYEPWYLIYVLPLVLLLKRKKEYGIGAFLISVLGLLYYVPYLFAGSWTIKDMGDILYGLLLSIFPITLFGMIIFLLVQTFFFVKQVVYEK